MCKTLSGEKMNAPTLWYKPAEIKLRPYQERMVNESRFAIAEHKKIICQGPTGFGKTIFAASILKSAANKGLRCAFIVDRIALVEQTSAVFDEYGISHGIIQAANKRFSLSEPIQICSIQTLKSRGHDRFDFVIIDEVHSLHAAHKKLIKESKFAIGLSATPWRNGLGKYFNHLVSPVTTRELINQGYLVDFKVYGPRTMDTTGLKEVAGDFVEKEMSERFDIATITGDIVSHYKKLANGKKTICFCVNIAHARHVAREFNKRGVSAVEINSYHKSGENSEREKIMRSFTDGDASVICSVDILGKGFDYPGVDCVILARPTKSLTVHVQQVGRGLRTYDGAPDCLILDHAGNHERLGFVDEVYNIPLNAKTKKKSAKKEDKKERKPVACSSCDFIKPVGVKKCPACGIVTEFIKDINVEDGELAEVKRKKKARREYDLDEKQAFLAGLNSYAAKKGMKMHWKGFYGWALYRYKDKFKCNPSNKMNWAEQGPITEDVKNFITHGFIKAAKEAEKET